MRAHATGCMHDGVALTSVRHAHGGLVRAQGEDTVSKVIQLANALETTRFTDFWTIAAGCKELLASGDWPNHLA